MMNLLGFYVKIFYEMAVNSQTVNKIEKKENPDSERLQNEKFCMKMYSSCVEKGHHIIFW